MSQSKCQADLSLLSLKLRFTKSPSFLGRVSTSSQLLCQNSAILLNGQLGKVNISLRHALNKKRVLSISLPSFLHLRHSHSQDHPHFRFPYRFGKRTLHSSPGLWRALINIITHTISIAHSSHATSSPLTFIVTLVNPIDVGGGGRDLLATRALFNRDE